MIQGGIMLKRKFNAIWVALALLSASPLPGGCEGLSQEEPAVNDGALCSENADCSSQLCTGAQLCGPSACECAGDSCGAAGKRSSSCADGWVCVDEKSLVDPIKEFFGGTPRKD